MTYKFYCRLCWQEFDTIAQHNRGSWYDKERLNKDCPGDIHPIDSVEPVKRPKKDDGERDLFS